MLLHTFYSIIINVIIMCIYNIIIIICMKKLLCNMQSYIDRMHVNYRLSNDDICSSNFLIISSVKINTYIYIYIYNIILYHFWH